VDFPKSHFPFSSHKLYNSSELLGFWTLSLSLTRSLIARVAVRIKRKIIWAVYVPYAKGVLEKFKFMGNLCNIKTIFKTKPSLRSLLMKTRQERDLQQIAQCVNVAEATLANQADLWPFGSVNTGTISKRFF
jgi:hypothetical protein